MKTLVQDGGVYKVGTVGFLEGTVDAIVRPISGEPTSAGQTLLFGGLALCAGYLCGVNYPWSKVRWHHSDEEE